jgi:hypothetical protein
MEEVKLTDPVLRSTVTVEFYCYERKLETEPNEMFRDARILDFVEYVVTADGKEIYRVKTTPRKWCASSEPLRVFEEWLIDQKPRGSVPKVPPVPKVPEPSREEVAEYFQEVLDKEPYIAK